MQVGTQHGGHVLIPTFVLNLPRDTERRRSMDAQLRSLGICHEITAGIDGNAVPSDVAARHRATFRWGHGREISPGELGCALAYLQLFRRIADGADRFVCVMEDDIEVLSTILPFLADATLAVLPTFDVLRLYSNESRQHRPALKVAQVGRHSIVAPVRADWGTYAQIFTREGAQKLTDQPITGPIDHMIYCDRPPFGLRIIEARPSLVRLVDFGSNIKGRPSRRSRPWHDRILAAVRDIKHPLRARLHFASAWGVRALYRATCRTSP